MKHAAIILLVLFVFRTAHAEVNVGYTLEWLADTSLHVGIYTAKTVKAPKDHSVHIEAVLAESLRGTAPKSFEFDYYLNPVQPDKVPPPKEGDKFLIFMRETERSGIRAQAIVNLTSPATISPFAALAPDFSVLKDGADIEKRVKARIAKKTGTPKDFGDRSGEIEFDVPPGTPAYEALFSGSACYLVVPEDLKELTKTPVTVLPRSAPKK